MLKECGQPEGSLYESDRGLEDEARGEYEPEVLLTDEASDGANDRSNEFDGLESDTLIPDQTDNSITIYPLTYLYDDASKSFFVSVE